VSESWTILSASDQANALFLPDQPHVTVEAVLTATDPTKVYAIPGDLRTRALGIEVAPTSPGEAPMLLSLFDAAGRKIADSVPVSGPDPRVVSMSLTGDSLSTSAGVYVKIAAPAEAASAVSSAQATAPEDFVLQVTRVSDASTPAPFSALRNLTTPVHLGDLPPPSALVAAVSNSTSSSDQEVIGSDALDAASAGLGMSLVVSSTPRGLQQLSSSVATGPLPERAGAPLGGLLAEGDPVPQLDRHDPALVDLALVGLAGPEARPEPAAVAQEAGVVRLERGATEGGSLVALRGPGGFPLLAAAPLGGQAADSEAPVRVLPPLVAMQPESGSQSASDPIPTGLVAEAEPGMRSARAASVVPGVSVAAALLLGLLRPGMSALLTVVESPRRRLRWRRRRPTGNA
jgi:hypothetical protein